MAMAKCQTWGFKTEILNPNNEHESSDISCFWPVLETQLAQSPFRLFIQSCVPTDYKQNLKSLDGKLCNVSSKLHWLVEHGGLGTFFFGLFSHFLVCFWSKGQCRFFLQPNTKDLIVLSWFTKDNCPCPNILSFYVLLVWPQTTIL